MYGKSSGWDSANIASEEMVDSLPGLELNEEDIMFTQQELREEQLETLLGQFLLHWEGKVRRMDASPITRMESSTLKCFLVWLLDHYEVIGK